MLNKQGYVSASLMGLLLLLVNTSYADCSAQMTMKIENESGYALHIENCRITDAKHADKWRISQVAPPHISASDTNAYYTTASYYDDDKGLPSHKASYQCDVIAIDVGRGSQEVGRCQLTVKNKKGKYEANCSGELSSHTTKSSNTKAGMNYTLRQMDFYLHSR